MSTARGSWPLFSVSIETEQVRVDTIHRLRVPDEKWTFVDKKGHGHFWKGKKVPTCKYVQVGTQWVGDEYEADEIPIMEWQCKECGQKIEPGYRDEVQPTHIPGPTWVTVVIDENEYIVTPEQYAESVGAWEMALRAIAVTRGGDIRFEKA